jgi:hypothetical protein
MIVVAVLDSFMSCGCCFGSGWRDLPEGFGCSDEVVSSEATIALKEAGGLLSRWKMMLLYAEARKLGVHGQNSDGWEGSPGSYSRRVLPIGACLYPQ